MPELPEVETIVKALKPIKGKTIEKIKVRWPHTVNNNKTAFTEALTEKCIVNVERKGKYICFQLENEETLTIHLGISGKLVFHPEKKDCKHLSFVFKFKDGPILYCIDTRKFARMKLWTTYPPLFDPKLGHEPLDGKTVFKAFPRKSRSSIKTVLLDQKILAGIGNIYADEALFCAGIHPSTPVNKILESKLQELSVCIPKILKAAIANEGTTISDYRLPDGNIGKYQNFLNVYGRTYLNCHTCTTPIDSIPINGHTSHFCPTCQPKEGSGTTSDSEQ